MRYQIAVASLVLATVTASFHASWAWAAPGSGSEADHDIRFQDERPEGAPQYNGGTVCVAPAGQ